MLASLPWYDLPELQPATDALWAGIARHLRRFGVGDVPSALERELDCFDQWQRDDLLLSQACGADVVRSTGEALEVIGTPTYDVPGCEAGQYRSWIVVRDDDAARDLHDLRGARCAINNPTSHSGHLALRAMVGPRPFFRDVIVSGSHVDSVALLSTGDVRVAAIDCVTWALLADQRPRALEQLRIIAATALAPAPPYVSGVRDLDQLARIGDALEAAFADPDLASARDALRLRDLTRSCRARYACLASPHANTADPVLAIVAA